MKLNSGYPYSLIRSGLPYTYPKLAENITADVAIIGGGISGALAAYYLVEAGFDCVVVDGRTIGLGSTCASTSLLQYEIDVPLSKLVKQIGVRDAVRAYTLCRDAIYTLGSIAKKLEVKEFEYNKSLYYASYKKHIAFIKEEFACRKQHGFKVHLLNDTDLRKEFNFYAPAAIFSQDGAYADAYLFTHSLHQHGIKKGLRVFDRTHIQHIKTSGNTITLTTDEHIRIKAKKVIYATGYEVTERLAKKIVTLHSTYVTVSESMPVTELRIKKDVMLWNTSDPYLYMRETQDGRMIVGGRDESFSSPGMRDRLIGHKSRQLVRDYEKLFPGCRFRPEFSWAGTFGTTADGLPFIGSNTKKTNHYYALGFGGNGITFSLIAAELIRDLLLGKKNPDAHIFAFDRV
jgi:glycine/D-amino acid oxidase-like deaminating enzyme